MSKRPPRSSSVGSGKTAPPRTHARKRSIALHGALWMTAGKASLGGQGRVELLVAIAAHGSINAAAKAVGMSYKAAWDAIDAMNNAAGEDLVERVTGGKGGGGTHLTQRGQRLVTNFRLLDREHQRFIAALDADAEGLAGDLVLLRRIAMRTSARNHLPGTIATIHTGAVNDEVELATTGGARIHATITRESTRQLGLAPGAEAFALIKASNVIVAAGKLDLQLSASNQLRGKVARLQRGKVNTEVVVDTGGSGIVAVVTNASAKALGLRAGMDATALFKASSVILGVPA